MQGWLAGVAGEVEHEISRFGGLPRELYFPKGLYFPEVRSTEDKYCHEGKYNYLGTTDT